jgi:SAM-dependent methyltransferase
VTEPTRSLAFDRVAHEYDRTRGGTERGVAAALAMLPLLPATGTVLEVGVGTGVVATALTGHGRDVVGVDLSLPMLTRAQARLPGRVVAGDASRLPIASDSVAAAVFVHVLHVVGDVAGTLAEAARVLRPGGRVVASAHSDERGDRNDVGDILNDFAESFGLMERVSRSSETGVTASARGCGLTLVERVAYQPEHLPITPTDAAERLRTRSWSWIWRVDEDEFAVRVEPALAALRALPDQDRPRSSGVKLPILAFELTG